MAYQAQGRSSSERRQAHTESIDDARILKRLADHVDGTEDMSQTQIRAAEILRKKKLPDLKALEVSAQVEGEITLKWEQ